MQRHPLVSQEVVMVRVVVAAVIVMAHRRVPVVVAVCGFHLCLCVVPTFFTNSSCVTTLTLIRDHSGGSFPMYLLVELSACVHQQL